MSPPSGVRSPTRQTHLSGPSVALDHRINAYRPDLASATLAAGVIAARYADPVRLVGTTASAVVHAAPDAASTAVSALLYGEAFDVIDYSGDWAWGSCVHDGYVGWVARAALAPPGSVAMHRISAPAAPVFAAPDIKTAVCDTLYLGSPVTGEALDDFVALAGGDFVHRRHVAPVDQHAIDAVAVALPFVGTPYVWGGRTRAGIDCSGLVQAALRATGIDCPRDSDQQLRRFGADIALEALQRGDLVFFPGHVGMMIDAAHLLHANAFWMTTLVEPLAAVVARLTPRHPVAITGTGRPEKA